jgi:hypothetical protein
VTADPDASVIFEFHVPFRKSSFWSSGAGTPGWRGVCAGLAGSGVAALVSVALGVVAGGVVGVVVDGAGWVVVDGAGWVVVDGAGWVVVDGAGWVVVPELAWLQAVPAMPNTRHAATIEQRCRIMMFPPGEWGGLKMTPVT